MLLQSTNMVVGYNLKNKFLNGLNNQQTEKFCGKNNQRFIIQINYLCLDLISDSITKMSSK